jgi:hypothetical protein
MSGRRIEPTYKVPALVRAPGHQVEMTGHYQKRFAALTVLLDLSR